MAITSGPPLRQIMVDVRVELVETVGRDSPFREPLRQSAKGARYVNKAVDAVDTASDATKATKKTEDAVDAADAA